MKAGASLLAAGVAALCLGPTTGQAQEFINVLTGGTSGVYYPLGVALSEIYAEGIEGARTQVQSTKASVENLNLLQSGGGEIAFALGDSVQLAVAGDEEAGFPAPLDKLRGIAAIYPNFIQIVATEESGIRTLADLKGKSLSVGRARLGDRVERARDLGGGGPLLRRPRPDRVSAIRRVGGADEEPAARRYAAVGRPRRRVDPRPRDDDADRGGLGAGGGRRRDRRAVSRGGDPSRDLRRPG